MVANEREELEELRRLEQLEARAGSSARPQAQSSSFPPPEYDLPGGENPLIKIMRYLEGSGVGQLKKGFEQGATFGLKDKLTGEKSHDEMSIPYIAGNVLGGGLAQRVPYIGGRTGQYFRNIGRAGAQGGLQAYGAGEEPGIGAGEAAILQAGLGKLGSGSKLLTDKDKLREFADERAIKSVLGQNLPSVRDVLNVGPKGRSVDYVDKNIRNVGKNIFEEDVLRPWQSSKETGPRLAETKNKYLDLLKNLQEGLDEAVPQGIVHGEVIANNIRNMARSIYPTNQNKKIIESLMGEAENFANRGRMTIQEAQQAKNAFQYRKEANTDSWMSNAKATNGLKKAVSDAMEESVQEFDKANPGLFTKDLLERYKTVKNKYGTFNRLSNIAGDRQVRDLNNRMISLTDYYATGKGGALGTVVGGMMGGPQGAALGGAAGGAMSGLAHRLARTRGSSTAALLANKWHDALGRSPQFAQDFGKFIVDALERGPAAMTTTHYLLNKFPEYQREMGDEE